MEEILLVGNPNSGKTTLYNALTRSNEHIGNWHGVTVEEKKKMMKVKDKNFLLVDTPGLYSLSPLSFEEEVSFKIIEGKNYKKIINICDRNNLQRNLYLSLCLLEENLDIVIAINEIDKKVKFKVDERKLSTMLGCDVILINAEKKIKVEALKESLLKENIIKPLPYLEKIDFSVVKNYFKDKNKNEQTIFAIKAFERNESFFKLKGYSDEEIKKIFSLVPTNSLEILTEARYNFLDEVIDKSCQKVNFTYGKSKLDKVLLNKYLALPLFLLIIAFIFFLTFFSLGAFLSDLLSQFLSLISSPILSGLKSVLGESWVHYLFSDAIFNGLSTVLSFLPQVVLLFFFLSLLEDSGYMSRIAFTFEDILGKVGLSGKSIYTLLMGFGCSTTAIMTARNMDNKNSKIKTALLCPYMSCSAKIPIYTVVGGVFFGASNIFVIMGLYLLGVVVAILVSLVLDKTVLKSDNQTFILEFPPYRVTSLRRLKNILKNNVKTFLVKVGSIMIAMNIIVFLLSSFTFKFQFVLDGNGSVLQEIGKFLAPIFEPLGFNNWAIVSALLAGLVAKEVVVSSIAMFNGVDYNATKLISSSILLSTSVVYFPSTASVLSFLVFCLLYTPCLASISMMKAEIGTKWTIVGIIIQLVVAYVLSFIVYNIALSFEIYGFWPTVIVILAILLVLVSIILIYRLIKHKKCPHNCSNCHRNCKKR